MPTPIDLPPIVADWDDLAQTVDRYAFDRLGWELIARAGQMCELLVRATAIEPDGSRTPLSLDEAVIGGLLVRLSKLLRALFDSTQSDESEAHQILARCALETAVNLRWLLLKNDPDEYKRFRADSFVTLIEWQNRTANEGETNPTADAISRRVQAHIDAELRAAGLTRADVQRRRGAWGKGNFRARLQDLGLDRLYLIFFSTHSYYVHGSWHELRAFHLRTEQDGLHLDEEYGGLAPPTAYETAIVVFDTVIDYVRAMPSASLEPESVIALAERSKTGTERASALFADFVSRGGLDDSMGRHQPK